jgi:cytidylate kinase
LPFLDTGATYRAVTLKAIRAGIDMTDDRELARQAREMSLKIIPSGETAIVEMDGADVTSEIRSEEVSRQSRHPANSPAVREILVQLQRDIGSCLGSFVSEGRDQGSVVFPQADFKFYLDADLDVRARRRHEEIAGRGDESDEGDVLEGIRSRDESDRGRSTGPLVVPEGAVCIDTTHMTPEQVVEEILRHVGGNA